MTKDQSDFGDILGFIASDKAILSKPRKVDLILAHFASNGIPLAVCCDHRHLKRSARTLKKRARVLGLSFPDYVPRHLRKKAAEDAAV